jgi:hypothetical protein
LLTIKPASGTINSEGIGGKIFSANIKKTIPKYPIEEIVRIIQLNIDFILTESVNLVKYAI